MHRELAESSDPTGVDDALWNAFMVETIDLLACGVILEQLGPVIVLGAHREPIVWNSESANWMAAALDEVEATCVFLLNTIIGGDPILRIIVVFSIVLKISYFATVRCAIDILLELFKAGSHHVLCHCKECYRKSGKTREGTDWKD